MDELILKPEELFFLAKLCGGHHLNYDYIALVPDLQHRAVFLQDACMTALEEKGVIEETWGEISVRQEATDFAAPIWNGEYESSLSLIELGEQSTEQTIYFHRLGAELVGVSLRQEELQILRLEPDDLLSEVYALMPEGYEKRTLPAETLLDDQPAEMIVVKNILMDGECANVASFFIVDNWLCRMEEDGYRMISAMEYLSTAVAVLKGE